MWSKQTSLAILTSYNMHCVSKKPDPETFYYNFTDTALISIKIGTHNLHDLITLQYYETVVYITCTATTLELKCASHYVLKS